MLITIEFPYLCALPKIVTWWPRDNIAISYGFPLLLVKSKSGNLYKNIATEFQLLFYGSIKQPLLNIRLTIYSHSLL